MNRLIHRISHGFWLRAFATLVLVGTAIFIWAAYIVNWDIGYNSDVAMIGLMAKNIAFAGERPIFVWSVGYQGVFLEAYLAAFFFKIFGVSPLVASLSPLVYCLAFVGMFFVTIRKFFDGPTAWLATVLLAIGSPGYFAHMLRTLPNYPEIHLGGMLGFLTFAALVTQLSDLPNTTLHDKEPRIFRTALLLGCLNGFLFYTFALSGTFMLAMCIQGFVLVAACAAKANGTLGTAQQLRNLIFPHYYIARRGLRIAVAIPVYFLWVYVGYGILRFFEVNISISGLLNDPTRLLMRGVAALAAIQIISFICIFANNKATARLLGGHVLGFVIGYAPSLYFRFVLGQDVGRSPSNSGSLLDIVRRFKLALRYQPRLLNVENLSPMDVAVATMISLALTFFLFSLLREAWQTLRGRLPIGSVHTYRGVFAFFPLAIILGYVFSSLIEDVEHGRWLVPLFMIYCLAFAFCCVHLWKLGGRLRWLRPMTAAIVLLVGVNNFASARTYVTTGRSFKKQHDAIIAALDENQITRGFGMYWLTYAVNLMTQERIILQSNAPAYNPYYDAIVSKEDRIAYVDFTISPLTPRNPTVSHRDRLYRVGKQQIVSEDITLTVLERIK